MKRFKQYFPLLFAIMALAFGCISCETEEPELKFLISVSTEELEFDSNGVKTIDVAFAANMDFSVAAEASWCKVVLKSEKEDYQRTYTISCEPNNLPEPRETVIKVVAKGNVERSIPVIQSGYSPAIEPEPVPDPEPDPEPEPEPELTPLTVDMVHNALGLGWNLGNQLDAHIDGVANETSWGNPAVTKALFDAVSRAGFTSVRIPVTWMGHVGPAPDYTIEAGWLNRVAEVVDYAESAGLRVIINMHHDGADSNYWLDIKRAATDNAVNTRVEAQIAAIWTQVAKKFADKGEFLIFESMNEIHDGGWGWGANRTDGGKQYRTFNHWQQVFVDAVRATGGKNLARWLGIPTYCTNIDLGANLTLPTDPSQRIMVAVHCYEPYDFTLAAKYSEWGHTGAAGLKAASDEKTLIGEFDKVVTRWISRGIPVYIGEFGCVRRDTERSEAFRKYYLEYFTKAATDRRIPVLYWDNGYAGAGSEQSGLFNRTDGSYFNNASEVVGVMTRGYFSPTLTLNSVYNSAPQ